MLVKKSGLHPLVGNKPLKAFQVDRPIESHILDSSLWRSQSSMLSSMTVILVLDTFAASLMVTWLIIIFHYIMF